jgi:chemotaxis methyl-accepting protein methylase
MPSLTGAPPPEMSPLEMSLWRELIGQRCGLCFSENRLRLLSQSLQVRMRSLSQRSYSDYYQFVVFHPDGAAEWLELLDLLLNRETSFFRHAPSFEALTGHVLPQLLGDRRRSAGGPVTLWSAGCSTGQEAYSLAMAFLETAGRQGGRAQVSASDINPRALDRARRGRYRPFEVRCLPEVCRDQYVLRVGDGDGTQYQVCDMVRELVQFGCFNLTDPDSYHVWGQDVIFCQNVLIYFPQEARAEIVCHLASRLNTGGYLFLGPAEAVGLRVAGLEPVRLENSLIYRRTR